MSHEFVIVFRFHMPRFNERRLAEINAERDEPVYRTRASRLERWRELVKVAQNDLQIQQAEPERLVQLGNWGQAGMSKLCWQITGDSIRNFVMPSISVKW